MLDFTSEEVLLARAILYRFLALAFHEPHAPLTAFLANAGETQALKAAAVALNEFSEDHSVSQIVDQMFEAQPGQGWPELDLRVEFTRLFLGPGEVPCQPYESLYDETRPEQDRGTVQGPSAFDMENLLAEARLEIDLGYKDLSDNIAIELEYMYYLLHQAVEIEAGPQSAEMERSQQFLRKHLAHWLPKFGERVNRHARHPFYLHLGSLLAAFMRLEVSQVEPDGVPA